jgi:hypothetical protein
MVLDSLMASNDFIARFKGKTTNMTKHGTFGVDWTKAINKTPTALQSSGQSIIRTSFESREKPSAQQSVAEIVHSLPIKATAYRPAELVIKTETKHLTALQAHSRSVSNPIDFTPVASDHSPVSRGPAERRLVLGKSFEHKRMSLGDLDNPVEPMTSTSGVSYSPYTMEDYRKIRPDRYYSLGGLGPSAVGTEDWNAKKVLFDRRADFARKLIQLHAEELTPVATRKSSDPGSKGTSARIRALEFASGIKKPPLKLPIELVKPSLSRRL